jgi:hydrogenase maturation factor HypF (carbamoyltransferase family)
VKNLDDGGVRIFSQAPPETLEQFIERLKNPPPPAVVKQLEIREAKVRPGLKGFRIRYGRLQDELQEGFGTVEAVFLYYLVGFGD